MANLPKTLIIQLMLGIGVLLGVFLLFAQSSSYEEQLLLKSPLITKVHDAASQSDTSDPLMFVHDMVKTPYSNISRSLAYINMVKEFSDFFNGKNILMTLIVCLLFVFVCLLMKGTWVSSVVNHGMQHHYIFAPRFIRIGVFLSVCAVLLFYTRASHVGEFKPRESLRAGSVAVALDNGYARFPDIMQQRKFHSDTGYFLGGALFSPFFRIFGDTVWGLFICDLVVSLGLMFLLFAFAVRFFNFGAGILTAFLFIFAPRSFVAFDAGANLSHITVVGFVICALWGLCESYRTERIPKIGICFLTSFFAGLAGSYFHTDYLPFAVAIGIMWAVRLKKLGVVRCVSWSACYFIGIGALLGKLYACFASLAGDLNTADVFLVWDVIRLKTAVFSFCLALKYFMRFALSSDLRLWYSDALFVVFLLSACVILWFMREKKEGHRVLFSLLFLVLSYLFCFAGLTVFVYFYDLYPIVPLVMLVIAGTIQYLLCSQNIRKKAIGLALSIVSTVVVVANAYALSWDFNYTFLFMHKPHVNVLSLNGLHDSFYGFSTTDCGLGAYRLWGKRARLSTSSKNEEFLNSLGDGMVPDAKYGTEDFILYAIRKGNLSYSEVVTLGYYVTYLTPDYKNLISMLNSINTFAINKHALFEGVAQEIVVNSSDAKVAQFIEQDLPVLVAPEVRHYFYVLMGERLRIQYANNFEEGIDFINQTYSQQWQRYVLRGYCSHSREKIEYDERYLNGEERHMYFAAYSIMHYYGRLSQDAFTERALTALYHDPERLGFVASLYSFGVMDSLDELIEAIHMQGSALTDDFFDMFLNGFLLGIRYRYGEDIYLVDALSIQATNAMHLTLLSAQIDSEDVPA